MVICSFDFLGWNFRKYNEKLIIKPSKKAVKLKLLKANHTSQIYSLESDIARRYPREITAATLCSTC